MRFRLTTRRIAPVLLCALAACTMALAQSPSDERLSSEDLEELLAPIALYPDPLLANVLAASVYADDTAAAAAYVAGGRTVTEETDVTWDPSVKAVAMFPEAIKKLGDYPEWTEALGQAYLSQPKDVMAAVQSLRAKAYANEALQSTPEQNVVVEGDTIVVEPADPEVIYVPRYDPAVVYVERSVRPAGVAVAFGVGVAVGAIHRALHCDWGDRCVVWSRRPIGWGPAYRPIYRPGLHGRPWGPIYRPRPIRPGWSRPWGGISTRPNIGVIPGRPSGSRPSVGNWRPPRPMPRPPAINRPNPPRLWPPGAGANRPQRPDLAIVPPQRPSTDRPSMNRPDRPGASPGRPPALLPNRPSDRPGRPPALRPSGSLGRLGLSAKPSGARPRPTSPPGVSRLTPRRDSGFTRPPSGYNRAPSRPSRQSGGSISRPPRPAPRPKAVRGRRG